MRTSSGSALDVTRIDRIAVMCGEKNATDAALWSNIFPTSTKMPSKVQPRRVAVALAVMYEDSEPNLEQTRVCLVRSRKHKDQWIIPKGGVEQGESTREAAARELWEEAGVHVSQAAPPWSTAADPITHTDKRPHSKCPEELIGTPSMIARAEYVLEEFRVHSSDVKDEWLEKDEREREFVPWPEACRRVSWREGMQELMERAHINTSGFFAK